MQLLLLLLLVLLLSFIMILDAKVFQVPVNSTGSLRARLIKEGRYQNFLKEMEAQRVKTGNLGVGQQPLQDYYDEFYVGSSTLWVIDSNCNTPSCNGRPEAGYTKRKFVTAASQTYINEGIPAQLPSSYGSVSGYQSKDVVAFGGMAYAAQEFITVNSLDDVYGYQPFDGILGLAWPVLAANSMVPPMQHMLPQLDAPIFTIWLERSISIAWGNQDGLITYGALDGAHCDLANLHYVPLTALTYWQFAIQGFYVGSYASVQTYQVASDTGTSWMLVPQSVYASIVQQTGAIYDPVNQGYTVDCATMTTNMYLVFDISGVRYSIPPMEYILDLGLGGGRCALAIMCYGGGGFGPNWVFGLPWIRTYCNVYDIGNQRIGFATAVQPNGK